MKQARIAFIAVLLITEVLLLVAANPEISERDDLTSGDPTSSPTPPPSATTTTGGSGNGTTSTTTGYSTTGSNDVKLTCEQRLTCSECTQAWSCLWCPSGTGSDTGGSCQVGYWYGKLSNGSCSHWQWKQCDVDGTVVLYSAIAGVGLVILILTVSIICCCCCCKKKKKRKHSSIQTVTISQDIDEEEGLLSKTPKTDAKRAELAKKYSIRSRDSDKKLEYKQF
eukprot:TRINITY_DN1980_c0_g1_i2.p1 TRINITY_DN1980_c0_g1~~TRINITY_DN1980_c0_g1_i2.p1  ORF type:complete len:224 (+),score=27.69 TRINITY_DN1980_c0_g1_i2:110-781(+)